MKTLYLIRHAKSDWSDPSQSDFDRPLNHRGEKNAPLMGSVLARSGVFPDLIVSSPARRAKSTAIAIAEQIGYNPDKIVYEDSLYLAETDTIMSVIHALSDTAQTVFLIGHNPGLTNFAEAISGYRVDNIPTCGIFVVESSCGAWVELTPGSTRFVSFDYPKKHKE